MGSCISMSGDSTKILPIGTNEKIEENPMENTNHDNSCIMCADSCDMKINLRCNHSFHAKCIVKWWANFPDNGMCCPMCRQQTHDKCFLEIAISDQTPYGYYRSDCFHMKPVIFRRGKITDDVETKIVCLPTKEARDIALYGFIKYLQMQDIQTHNQYEIQLRQATSTMVP